MTSLINNYLVHHYERGKENPGLEHLKAKSSSKSNAPLSRNWILTVTSRGAEVHSTALQTVLTCY